MNPIAWIAAWRARRARAAARTDLRMTFKPSTDQPLLVIVEDEGAHLFDRPPPPLYLTEEEARQVAARTMPRPGKGIPPWAEPHVDPAFRVITGPNHWAMAVDPDAGATGQRPPGYYDEAPAREIDWRETPWHPDPPSYRDVSTGHGGAADTSAVDTGRGDTSSSQQNTSYTDNSGGGYSGGE